MTTPFFLLADDDEDDRFFFATAVKSINNTIQCLMVRNGRELLTVLENDIFALPDYIFLDLNMPVMDGLKCLAAIKKVPAYADLPVILYSTTLDKQAEYNIMAAGAYACFVKPLGIAELAGYLRQLCKL
jgi:CheY-like chemotaxis protein